jgi:rubrerythrin
MKDPTNIGTNRTGIGSSPKLVREMLSDRPDGKQQASRDAKDEWAALRESRQSYMEEADALGTVPPPNRVAGMAKSMLKALKGEKATVLVDKLGERLAYERSGVRLYDAFLLKLETLEAAGGPSLSEVRRIRDEEKRHFDLLRRAIEAIGADPTAETPSADLEAVATAGLFKAMSDPRTGVREGLQLLLHAELGDGDGWELLIELYEALGEDEFLAGFREAQDAEIEHLSLVRRWLRDMTTAKAGADTDEAD